MNTKEKALEIFNMFYGIVGEKYESKLCATETCGEIIKEVNGTRQEYWQGVIEEIYNL